MNFGQNVIAWDNNKGESVKGKYIKYEDEFAPHKILTEHNEIDNFLNCEIDTTLPDNTDDLPEKVRHLSDRYPFDKTLKAPKDDHRPYLNDGSEELNKVEADVRDGTLDPRYIRYFYTVTNRLWEYLAEIPEEMREIDNMEIE